jgi:hypothetical protein
MEEAEISPEETRNPAGSKPVSAGDEEENEP